jgi:tetratricopeptide (TPR) repeat protein
MTTQDHAALLDEVLRLPEAGRAARLGPDASAALAGLIDESEKLVISDLDRAGRATEAVLRLADACTPGDAALRARARRIRAQALAYANRFEDAIGLLDEAIDIAEAGGCPLESARARATSLHALARLGRYDEAVRAGEQARAAFVEYNEPMLAARADMNLGVVHRMRDDPRRALEHFTLARPVIAQDPVLSAQLESNSAEAMLDLNNFAGAETAFRAAMEAFQRGGMARAAAIVEGNLADLMSRQGRPGRAIEHFERALRRFHEAEAPGDAARLEAEYAEALASVGLHAEALESFASAVPVLTERGMAWEAARARVGMGRAMLRLGRIDRAEAALREASDAFASLGHASGRALADLARADVAAARADPAGAIRLLRDAAAALEQRPALAAAAQLRLAGAELARGNDGEAAQQLDGAMAAAADLDLAPLLAEALHARARIRLAQEDPAGAVADLAHAAEQVERLRGTLPAEPFRAALLDERASIYHEWLAAVLDAGGPGSASEAFRISERARSRSLLDLLQGGAELVGLRGTTDGIGGDPGSAGDEGLLAELASRRGELNALYRELDEKKEHAAQRSDQENWQARLADCEKAIARLERRLAATGRFAGVFAEPVTADAAARLLPDGWAMAAYVADAGRLSALVLDRQGVRPVRGLAPLDRVREGTARLRFQIDRAIARGLEPGPKLERMTADAKAELRDLHAHVLAPVLEELGSPRGLVVVPFGPLHGVPFHALEHDGRAAIEDLQFSYAPSAGVLAHMSGRGADPREGALVVGVGDELAPRVEQEARRIARAIPDAQLLIGNEATVQRVREAAAGRGLIHLASHARFSRTDPLSSGIRLADGWLTARDVYTMQIQGALVTLSGCETGMAGAGEELIGLIRGFLVAGAAGLTVGFWAVHDESAEESMAAAYHVWYSEGASSGGFAAALRRAQVQAVGRQAHPAAWAPWCYVGLP